MAATPTSFRLRAYQVGFGDCFLLTFHYRTTDRHVLIDFGSTGRPKGADSRLMDRVAASIRDTCGGKLHAVVATHRHKDHVSGFATRADGTGSGDVIAALAPDVVIQPWTEDPHAQPGDRRPTRVSQPGRAFIGMLGDMHGVARAIYEEANSWPRKTPFRARLSFMGDNNLANLSAVENLMRMGKRQRYVHYGASSGIRMPGVKIRVLGPPTLEQSQSIEHQRSRDEGEFWHLMALAGGSARSSSGRLFAEEFELRGPRPKSSRWLRSRIKSLRRDQLREIVRILDKALNNTSVILLFEVGGHKLLLPGDAQIENWSYALRGAPDSAEVRRLLADTTLYKVGHHGSLNATPLSLWEMFRHRSRQESPDRLHTFVSTMRGKHGSESRETEVPRRTLVQALAAESDYHTTQKVPVRDLFVEQTFVV